MEEERIASLVVDAAIKVHRVLGPGLLESVYEQCLGHELRKRGLKVETQVVLPVAYEELRFEVGYRLDMVVNDTAILELKSVEHLLPVHKAQLLTYLKIAQKRLGLLINFNVPVMKDGISRLIL